MAKSINQDSLPSNVAIVKEDQEHDVKFIPVGTESHVSSDQRKRKANDSTEKVPDTESIKCENCKWNFSKKVGYYLHYHNCYSGHPFKCTICNGIVSNLDKLFSHYFKDHLSYTQDIAKLAKWDGILTDQVGDIINSHSNGFHREATKASNFNCKHCSEPFRLMLDFKIHENFCKSFTNNVFQCQLCEHTSVENFAMIRHYKQVHPTDLGTFMRGYGNAKIIPVCPYCQKIFEFKRDLQSHGYSCMTLENPGQEKPKAFQKSCKRCKYRFRSELHFELHLGCCLFSEEDQPFSFTCHLCQKYLIRMDKLVDHYKQTHVNYVKNCFEEINKRKELKLENDYHDGALGTGARKWACEKCKVKFKLQISVRIHYEGCKRGLSSNVCHVCHQSFKRFASLAYHYENAHSSLFESLNEGLECQLNVEKDANSTKHQLEKDDSVKATNVQKEAHEGEKLLDEKEQNQVHSEEDSVEAICIKEEVPDENFSKIKKLINHSENNYSNLTQSLDGNKEEHCTDEKEDSVETVFVKEELPEESFIKVRKLTNHEKISLDLVENKDNPLIAENDLNSVNSEAVFTEPIFIKEEVSDERSDESFSKIRKLNTPEKNHASLNSLDVKKSLYSSENPLQKEERSSEAIYIKEEVQFESSYEELPSNYDVKVLENSEDFFATDFVEVNSNSQNAYGPLSSADPLDNQNAYGCQISTDPQNEQNMVKLTFAGMQTFKNAEKKAKKTYKYLSKCTRCEAKFKTELNYLLHYESCLISDHKIPGSLQCHICLKKLSRTDILFSHYRIFHEEFMETCKRHLELKREYYAT